MGKTRIYEVARQYHISSEALLNMLRGTGFEVKSHMSVANDEMLAWVHRRFEEEKESYRLKIRKKRIRTERRKEEAAAAAEKKRRKRRRKRRKREGLDAARPTTSETSPKPPKGPEESRRTAKERVGKERGEKAGKERRQKASKEREERIRKRQIEQEWAVQENIRRTLAQLEGPSRPRHRSSRSAHRPQGGQEEERNVIRVSEFISTAELAQMMEVTPSEVVAKCFEMGLLVTINQRLDMDTITMVADEFGFETEQEEEYAEDLLDIDVEDDGYLEPRHPVVTVMGHVDHGKTSLLDYIRKTNIVAGEAGGITQHIGAYEVELEHGKVTFLDTPGHEAFTAMRARGAQLTDVVVLVIAADEEVMPQTIEAINHAQAAGVPIIVAINKIDRPNADPQRIKQQLSQHGILVEEWGGKTVAVEVSAKTGEGVDHLLEMLVLESELLELKANPRRLAKGVIIESQLDRGRGAVATVLVQEGTLRIGDCFVTGMYSGKVRVLLDERGRDVEEAGPSTPVQVVGMEGTPEAGDSFFVVPSEQEAREISRKRQQLRREQEHRRRRRVVTLATLGDEIREGKLKDLNLIVKGDVDGSVGALSDSLMELSNEEVRVNVIHRGVGAISESDVLLASASDAIIIGFNVRPEPRVRELAAQEQVDIRLYRIIYEVIEDVKAALSGMLAPDIHEEIQGTAEVRDTFRVPQAGTIAGCYVQSGTIRRNAAVRVIRDNVVVYEGEIASLRRFKDDVREVTTGYECGVGVRNFNDIKVGDRLETFETVETARQLS